MPTGRRNPGIRPGEPVGGASRSRHFRCAWGDCPGRLGGPPRAGRRPAAVPPATAERPRRRRRATSRAGAGRGSRRGVPRGRPGWPAPGNRARRSPYWCGWGGGGRRLEGVGPTGRTDAGPSSGPGFSPPRVHARWTGSKGSRGRGRRALGRGALAPLRVALWGDGAVGASVGRGTGPAPAVPRAARRRPLSRPRGPARTARGFRSHMRQPRGPTALSAALPTGTAPGRAVAGRPDPYARQDPAP